MIDHEELRRRLGERFGPFLGMARLAPDASTRLFHRVHRGDGTLAVLLTDPSGGRSAIERLVEAQRLLSAIGVPVPALLDAEPALASVLLEDFGDLLLADAVDGMPRDRLLSAYRDAARIAARIATRGTPLVGAGHPLADRPLARRRLRQELQFFVVRDVVRRRGPNDEALLGRLGRALDRIAEELGRHQPELAHRDFHARNMLLAQGDRLGVVDFQDTLLAPPLYDLASLLFDPYVEMDEELRCEVAAAYASEAGLTDDPLGDPRLPWVAMQRLLKALGTYAFQLVERENDRFAPAVERAERSAVATCGKIQGDFGHELHDLLVRLDFST